MIWFTALLVWVLLTWGFSYAAARAELIEPVRIHVISFFGGHFGRLGQLIEIYLSWLLSCFICTSFWTGQAAACVVMAHLPVPWYSWIYTPPAAGFCAVGFVDMMAFVRRGAATPIPRTAAAPPASAPAETSGGKPDA